MSNREKPPSLHYASRRALAAAGALALVTVLPVAAHHSVLPFDGTRGGGEIRLAESPYAHLPRRDERPRNRRGVGDRKRERDCATQAWLDEGRDRAWRQACEHRGAREERRPGHAVRDASVGGRPAFALPPPA